MALETRDSIRSSQSVVISQTVANSLGSVAIFYKSNFEKSRIFTRAYNPLNLQCQNLENLNLYENQIV